MEGDSEGGTAAGVTGGDAGEGSGAAVRVCTAPAVAAGVTGGEGERHRSSGDDEVNGDFLLPFAAGWVSWRSGMSLCCSREGDSLALKADPVY